MFCNNPTQNTLKNHLDKHKENKKIHNFEWAGCIVQM